MKIGVISDTHDRLEAIERAIAILSKEKVELIVHCGDWVSPFTIEFFDMACGGFRVPVKSVFGNNEGDIARLLERNAKLKNPIVFSSKKTLDLDLDGKRVIVYHGDDRSLLNGLIQSRLYDVVFTGHTHAIRNEMIGSTLVFNPGALCYARESKIIKQASVGIYSTKNNEANVIDLT